VTFSPDSRLLASGGHDQTIKVWDPAASPEPLTIFPVSSTGVVFSPDGTRLASASGYVEGNSWKAVVKVWDAQTGRELLSLKGHTDVISSVVFSPDGKSLASASRDKTVKVWDLPSGRLRFSLDVPTDIVQSVAYSPDGARLAAGGSFDGTVWVWDPATGRRLRTYRGEEANILGLAFSPDGRRLASAGPLPIFPKGGAVTVRDVTTEQTLLTIKGSAPVQRVAFSPGGDYLASSGEQTVKVWNAATGAEVLALDGHGENVYGIAFSPDGKRLASASWDKTVRVWELVTGQEVLSFNLDSRGFGVAFSPDGKRLAASSDTRVQVWDATARPSPVSQPAVPGPGK
jgi:WD40 repeat protein